MPTRMIRDALLSSERFLNLPDNTSRICYVSCILTADDRGNLEGGNGYLVRLWRDFGVDNTEKAASIGGFLSDQDLIRFYNVGEKRYVHVPRFGQRMRSFKRACPPSPWCEIANESTDSSLDCQQVAASCSKSPPEEKRREEKYTLQPDGFERFYRGYPKKKSRGDAEKAWRTLRPTEPLIAEILQGLQRAIASPSWQKESGRYIPHPATWLRDKGWLDEEATLPPENRMGKFVI